MLHELFITQCNLPDEKLHSTILVLILFFITNCFQKDQHKLTVANQRISTEEKIAKDEVIVTLNI